MKWYWRVRMQSAKGTYCIVQIETAQNLDHISVIQDFYHSLTGCKMILEGMSETPYDLLTPNEAFNNILP